MLGGGAGSIALVEPDGALRFRTVQGPAAPRLIERTLPHGTGLLGWSIAHRTPLIVDDPAQRSAPRAPRSRARPACAPQHLMVAPLVDGEDVIGGIEIIDQRRTRARRRRPWSDDDLKLLVLIAAQAASAIGLARRRSEQSNRDRLASIGRMLAGLLHDLKTPMTIISGYAQLMAASDDAAQRETYVEQIQRQFDLMAGMTREVLAFARGDTDLVVRKVYVNRFVEELDDAARRGDRGPRHRLRGRGRSSTASRTSTSRSCCACSTTSRATRSRRCPRAASCASIVDTGRRPARVVGHATPARASRPSCAAGCSSCSRPARRAAPASGLAIVKKIVDDHHGTITVETGPTGTTFIMKLPLQRATDGD